MDADTIPASNDFVAVPLDLWEEIKRYVSHNEYDRGIGRDHSHCSSCNACNDGGCGPGTHKHKDHCFWHRIETGVLNVDVLEGIAGDA